MRRRRLWQFWRSPHISIFIMQFGDLTFQNIDLTPLRGDNFIQIGNCLVLVRNPYFQIVQARKVI